MPDSSGAALHDWLQTNISTNHQRTARLCLHSQQRTKNEKLKAVLKSGRWCCSLIRGPFVTSHQRFQPIPPHALKKGASKRHKGWTVVIYWQEKDIKDCRKWLQFLGNTCVTTVHTPRKKLFSFCNLLSLLSFLLNISCSFNVAHCTAAGAFRHCEILFYLVLHWYR